MKFKLPSITSPNVKVLIVVVGMTLLVNAAFDMFPAQLGKVI